MVQGERNLKIMKAIEAKTNRVLASKQAARQSLVDEGIYTKDGDLRVEFGGSSEKKASKTA
ncbi:hypothetical protein [Prosthecomicrobium hirschii]|uniref:hypothetical protein n=1 Tax=Prosthecodimorpha hirschii TaxID=665126 RepID=UPI00128FA50E|nr:hypothetical protein [Prosthecomicrobium hirschii]MCW1841729.1 hypothetical protein [Prosthecomicrobium hirschii]